MNNHWLTLKIQWLISCSRVRENLGILIQTGSASVGHSSVEDAAATLDLVRWYILNKPKPKPALSKDALSLSTSSSMQT